MKSILDPSFKYTPAKEHEGNADYLRAKFRKIRAEQRAQAEATRKVVTPLAKRKPA